MTYQAETSYVTAAAARDLDQPRLYAGVRTRRILAFLFDYALVLILSIPAAILVFVLGLISLGLAWGLYAVLLPVIAIVYVGFTMGSAAQATPGMRIADLRVRRLDGARVDPVLAVLHGVLFWASVSVLTPLVLLVALFTGRKQLLHDLLLGTVIVRDN
ncbi:RDD family protein [Aurantimonas sp. HBX-1]|uniref:RDD family protein n=1 Tax=Aurantimonas sp. HBX-1 TaxID=2906072 RepID=UPI001F44049E|nr:RDD family protein [Aurantimonas sp. HBX-1]UIJ70257.1 RDD family protein [Aurantimonas sp. HBX-1]